MTIMINDHLGKWTLQFFSDTLKVMFKKYVR
jgi:hypothetical protein